MNEITELKQLLNKFIFSKGFLSFRYIYKVENNKIYYYYISFNNKESYSLLTCSSFNLSDLHYFLIF